MKISKEQIAAIAFGVVTVLNLFGIEIASEQVNNIVQGVVGLVGILATLGIIKEGKVAGRLTPLGGKK